MNNVSVLIKKTILESGVTQYQLAEKLGKSESYFSYKVSKGIISLNDLQAIAEALGAEVEVTFKMPNGTILK